MRDARYTLRSSPRKRGPTVLLLQMLDAGWRGHGGRTWQNGSASSLQPHLNEAKCGMPRILMRSCRLRLHTPVVPAKATSADARILRQFDNRAGELTECTRFSGPQAGGPLGLPKRMPTFWRSSPSALLAAQGQTEVMQLGLTCVRFATRREHLSIPADRPLWRRDSAIPFNHIEARFEAGSRLDRRRRATRQSVSGTGKTQDDGRQDQFEVETPQPARY